MSADKITAQRLRELVSYDAATGEFAWLVKRGNAELGSSAGYINSNGYRVIRLDGVRYRAHRLAWFFVHGVWPSENVDHINGDRADNRIANLRDITQAENLQNQKRAHNRSKTGLLGAWPSGDRFQSCIRVNGKYHELGRFDTAEEAHAAYLAAKSKLHKFQTLVTPSANPAA